MCSDPHTIVPKLKRPILSGGEKTNTRTQRQIGLVNVV